MGRRQRGGQQPRTQLEKAIRDHMPRPRADLDLPKLLSREDRLLEIFDALGAAVYEFDASGRAVYASPNSEKLLGFSADDVLRSDCLEFHADDLPTVIATGRRVRDTGEITRNEVRLRHRSGDWVWVETTLAAWNDPAGGGFHTMAFVRDVTDLEVARAARRESERRYRVVAQARCDLIFETDANGRATYVGPGTEEILGYSPEELLRIEPFALVHPDDSERVRTHFRNEFRDGADDAPGEIPRPHRLRSMEHRGRHRDGRWLWFETRGVTYRRADGEVRYLGVSRDVTEQRRAEQARRELEQGMQQAQRLESLGVMAGGIAHDFNNLLTPILGAAGLGLSDLPADSPVRAHFEKIQTAAMRAEALVSQMLAYAGQRTLRIEPLDLSRQVADMQALLASTASGEISFDLQLDPDLPAVHGEAAQISQIILNLVTNAVESLREGVGRIAIRTGSVRVSAPLSGALFAETMSTGLHVYLEVSDAGCGMEAATRARIFDPFFTTKFTGRGLGLAAVAGIVRAHRGAIEVESEPGRGTRFRVLLPASGRPVPTAAAPTPRAEGWRGSGTVLVIDDDEGVRDLAAAVLRGAGMTVLTAADGHEGVKLFGMHAGAVRLVLLDRTMPELSGIDTLKALRALRPDLAVVLVSGYAEERVTAELAGSELAGFLKKPFLPEDLLARVRAVLER